MTTVSLQYVDVRFLLVRDRGDNEVGPGAHNLFGVGSPGVGEDGTRLRCNFWNYIGAILRAGHQAVQLTELCENDRCAGLQAGNAARRVRGGHDSQTRASRDSAPAIGRPSLVARRGLRLLGGPPRLP